MSTIPDVATLRSRLLHSVTYVRASFPWELRDLPAANDAGLRGVIVAPVFGSARTRLGDSPEPPLRA